MSVHQFAGLQIGYLAAFAIIAVIMGLDRRWWAQRARKLAAQSDIALPGPLAGRVARFLRNEYLFGQLMVALMVPSLSALLIASQAHRNWAAWLPWILAGLPLYWAVACFLLSLWPRWKASGGYRVTHLGTVPARQAFTTAEFTAVQAGVAASAALGAWGLWHIAAPAIGWLACAVALAAAVAAWRYAATSVMSRPSSASDEIELGWDDLLRFRQVRTLTAGAAWGTAAFAYLIDCVISSAFIKETTAPGEVSYQVQWWPVVVPVVVGLLLSRVFRQGRHLWRQAWLERDRSG